MDNTIPEGYVIRSATDDEIDQYIHLRNMKSRDSRGKLEDIGHRLTFYHPERTTYFVVSPSDEIIGFGDEKQGHMKGSFIKQKHQGKGLFPPLAETRIEAADTQNYSVNAVTDHAATQHVYKEFDFYPVRLLVSEHKTGVRMRRIDGAPSTSTLYVPDDYRQFIENRLNKLYDTSSECFEQGGNPNVRAELTANSPLSSPENADPAFVDQKIDELSDIPDSETVRVSVDLTTTGAPEFIEKLENRQYSFRGIDMVQSGDGTTPVAYMDNITQEFEELEVTETVRGFLKDVGVEYDACRTGRSDPETTIVNVSV